MPNYVLATAAEREKLEDAACDPALAKAIVNIFAEREEAMATKTDSPCLVDNLG